MKELPTLKEWPRQHNYVCLIEVTQAETIEFSYVNIDQRNIEEKFHSAQVVTEGEIVPLFFWLSQLADTVSLNQSDNGWFVSVRESS